jgi:hypothetical protein
MQTFVHLRAKLGKEKTKKKPALPAFKRHFTKELDLPIALPVGMQILPVDGLLSEVELVTYNMSANACTVFAKQKGPLLGSGDKDICLEDQIAAKLAVAGWLEENE